MSNSTLQMMTDILYEYFRDLAQSVKKFSEICEYLIAYGLFCNFKYWILFIFYMYTLNPFLIYYDMILFTVEDIVVPTYLKQ